MESSVAVDCDYFIGNAYIAGSNQIAAAVLPTNKGRSFSTGVVPQLFAAILAVIQYQRRIVCTSSHGNYGIFNIEFGDVDIGSVTVDHQILSNNYVASGFKIAYIDIACDTDYIANELISINIANSTDQSTGVDVGSG